MTIHLGAALQLYSFQYMQNPKYCGMQGSSTFDGVHSALQAEYAHQQLADSSVSMSAQVSMLHSCEGLGTSAPCYAIPQQPCACTPAGASHLPVRDQ